MSGLSRARWVDLASNRDARGVLTAVEVGKEIAFEVRRVFYMHDVVAPRGAHAHRDTEQLLVAVAGSFEVALSDDREALTYALDTPVRGLYVPPMVWVDLHGFSPGAVCLVLASTSYQPARTIRSRQEYLEALVEQRSERLAGSEELLD